MSSSARFVAFLVKYLLEALGIPSPFPMLIALVAFLVVAFGGSRFINLN
jgi:hypothetical protein